MQPSVRVQSVCVCLMQTMQRMLLHCALAAAQCIVIGPVCSCVTVMGLLPR